MISEENGSEMNCVSKSAKPSQSNMLVRNFKMFEEVENAGSEISYRCRARKIACTMMSVHTTCT